MNKLEWYERTAEIIADNIEDFYQQFYPLSIQSKTGDGFRLQPCPMCGHHDCCTIGVAVNCFSCGWSGTHISGWYSYATNKLDMSLSQAIKKLEEFTGINFPVASKEEFESYQRHQRCQEILRFAENFYHDMLFKTSKTFVFKSKNNDKDQILTPLDYLLTIRKRNLETVKTLKIGFTSDYLELYRNLQSAGYSKEEIKEADIWAPENLFIFFYRHPITKDIVRFNTKNPFGAKFKKKDELGNDIDGEVIPGYSKGNKIMLFTPGFSFKKPIILVEGEHDLAALIENEGLNIACLGGNASAEEFEILDKAENTIFIATDNDMTGEKYVKELNEMYPEKDLRRVNFSASYKDIDEYYVGEKHPKPLKELLDESIPLQTESHKIKRENNCWTIVNRYKKLEFTIKGKNEKGQIIGVANYYSDNKLLDREENVSLTRCKARMKPFNFYLSDAIDEYFNANLKDKNIDELADIYWFSSQKAHIINLLARKLYESGNDETIFNNLKVKLRTPDGRDDVIDTILKEVNDIQNKSNSISYSSIPKIKIAQYFNTTNKDAYMYFINVKQDGDTVRKLPFLLRNDKHLIRLDLLKRKDSQCLLLIDNKYELPFEVNEAVMELSECSLTQEWVYKWAENKIPQNELSPNYLVKKIEEYIRKFYYINDNNTYKVLALYAYTTYYYTLFNQIAYLYLNGQKGSGKSILDSALQLFCFDAKMAVEISEAALFRLTAIEGGTIILDEIENMTSRKSSRESTMASILKGGYTSSTPIYRVNQEKGITESFDTYGPKIISNIMGLEDIVSDRCIPISTYRLNVTKNTKMEDPRFYRNERLSEIREVTSKCCISALENFMTLKNIYDGELFETGNARMSQILTPLLAIAKLADIEERDCAAEKYPDLNPATYKGEFESALINFYNDTMKHLKEEVEEGTPEGIIKKIVPIIAKELQGLIPLHQCEYTIDNNHKYGEKIKMDKNEGWFELNVLHFKCFIEENMPGETAYARLVPRWIKTVFQFKEKDIRRRTAHIENEDLIKEFKGNKVPKVNSYRFYFRDFISNDFLDSKDEKRNSVNADADKSLF